MAKSVEDEIRDLGIVEKVEQVEPTKKARPVSAPKKVPINGVKVIYDENGKIKSSMPM